MPFVIEDLQKFTKDAEEYVHTVIALNAPNESDLEAATVRVVERLAAVLDAMLEGIPAIEAANAIGAPERTPVANPRSAATAAKPGKTADQIHSETIADPESARTVTRV